MKELLIKFFKFVRCYIFNIFHEYKVYNRNVNGYLPKIINGTNYNKYYINEYYICNFCQKTSFKTKTFKTSKILFTNGDVINEYLKYNK